MNKSFVSIAGFVQALMAMTLVMLGLSGWAQQAQVDLPLAGQVQQMARQALSGLPSRARVDIEVGSIDSRLKLAPCAQITPYLPNGVRLWGRAQVGMRCTRGAHWNVFIPVTVKVFAPAWAMAQPLSAGTVLQPAHFQEMEVDLAAEAGPVITSPEAATGRTLARALRAGQALRESDLKPRLWFAAGDTVRVVSLGTGFSITAEGLALSAGFDGQTIKVRTEGGRVVQGRAVGARQVQVAL